MIEAALTTQAVCVQWSSHFGNRMKREGRQPMTGVHSSQVAPHPACRGPRPSAAATPRHLSDLGAIVLISIPCQPCVCVLASALFVPLLPSVAQHVCSSSSSLYCTYVYTHMWHVTCGSMWRRIMENMSFSFGSYIYSTLLQIYLLFTYHEIIERVKFICDL